MKSVLILLVAGWLLFELVEHAVLPLIWFMKDRKKRSVCGPTGMLGELGEVKNWQGFEGQIIIRGELWRAVSKSSLSVGDRVLVGKVDGLTLSVVPFMEKPRRGSSCSE